MNIFSKLARISCIYGVFWGSMLFAAQSYWNDGLNLSVRDFTQYSHMCGIAEHDDVRVDELVMILLNFEAEVAYNLQGVIDHIGHEQLFWILYELSQKREQQCSFCDSLSELELEHICRTIAKLGEQNGISFFRALQYRDSEHNNVTVIEQCMQRFAAHRYFLSLLLIHFADNMSIDERMMLQQAVG